MLRSASSSRETALEHSHPSPRFEVARRWRPWHEMPGLIPVVSGVVLWFVVVGGVIAPLGGLARL